MVEFTGVGILARPALEEAEHDPFIYARDRHRLRPPITMWKEAVQDQVMVAVSVRLFDIKREEALVETDVFDNTMRVFEPQTEATAVF